MNLFFILLLDFKIKFSKLEHNYFYRFVSGVVSRERVPGFEKMLWRISRGNVFLRQSAIENPLQDPTNVSTRIKENNFKVKLAPQ